MPMPSEVQAAEFAPGMMVRLSDGQIGRIRAFYEFEPALAPHSWHRRALLIMADGSKGDVRADQICVRVSGRPALAVVPA